jgi:hypothetical protein
MSKVEEVIDEEEVEKPTTKDQQKQRQALNNMSSSVEDKETNVDSSKAQEV